MAASERKYTREEKRNINDAIKIYIDKKTHHNSGKGTNEFSNDELAHELINARKAARKGEDVTKKFEELEKKFPKDFKFEKKGDTFNITIPGAEKNTPKEAKKSKSKETNKPKTENPEQLESNFLKKFADKIRKKDKEIIERREKTADKEQGIFGNALSNLGDVIGSVTDSISGHVDDVLGDIKTDLIDPIKNAGSSILGTTSKMFGIGEGTPEEKTNTLLGSIANGIDRLGDKFLTGTKNIEDSIDDLETSTEKESRKRDKRDARSKKDEKKGGIFGGVLSKLFGKKGKFISVGKAGAEGSILSKIFGGGKAVNAGETAATAGVGAGLAGAGETAATAGETALVGGEVAESGGILAGLTTFLGGLLPILTGVAALAGLVVAIGVMTGQIKISDILDGFKSLYKQILPTLQLLGKTFMDMLKKIIGPIKVLISSMIPIAEKIFKGIAPIIVLMVKGIGGVLSKIFHFIGSFFGVLTKILSPIIKIISWVSGLIISSLMPFLKVIGWTFNLIMKGLGFVIDGLTLLLNGIGDIVSFFTDTIPGWFSDFFSFIGGVFSSPLKFADNIVKGIWNFFTDTIPGWIIDYFEFIGSVFSHPLKFASGIINIITDFFTKTIPGWFNKIFDHFKNFVEGYLSKIPLIGRFFKKDKTVQKLEKKQTTDIISNVSKTITKKNADILSSFTEENTNKILKSPVKNNIVNGNSIGLNTPVISHKIAPVSTTTSNNGVISNIKSPVSTTTSNNDIISSTKSLVSTTTSNNDIISSTKSPVSNTTSNNGIISNIKSPVSTSTSNNGIISNIKSPVSTSTSNNGMISNIKSPVSTSTSNNGVISNIKSPVSTSTSNNGVIGGMILNTSLSKKYSKKGSTNNAISNVPKMTNGNAILNVPKMTNGDIILNIPAMNTANIKDNSGISSIPSTAASGISSIPSGIPSMSTGGLIKKTGLIKAHAGEAIGPINSIDDIFKLDKKNEIHEIISNATKNNSEVLKKFINKPKQNNINYLNNPEQNMHVEQRFNTSTLEKINKDIMLQKTNEKERMVQVTTTQNKLLERNSSIMESGNIVIKQGLEKIFKDNKEKSSSGNTLIERLTTQNNKHVPDNIENLGVFLINSNWI